LVVVGRRRRSSVISSPSKEAMAVLTATRGGGERCHGGPRGRNPSGYLSPRAST
jgi:hypothetical protein